MSLGEDDEVTRAVNERTKTLNEFLELGFDEIRAQILMAEGVQSYRAKALVEVCKCPVDLAFEILR